MAMQIFVRQSGTDPISIEVQPSDTIGNMKEQAGLQNKGIWRGKTFLKNSTTFEQNGVKAGDELNAVVTNKTPGSFSSRSEYQAAQRIKIGRGKFHGIILICICRRRLW